MSRDRVSSSRIIAYLISYAHFNLILCVYVYHLLVVLHVFSSLATKMKTKGSKGSHARASEQRPTASASTAERDSDSPEAGTELGTTSDDTHALKMEILTSLRKDLAEIFRSELQSMLGDDLATIKSELQAVKAEFSNSMVSMQMDMAALKGTVKDMEHSLSTCSDDVTELREKVESLSAAVVKLEDKCEDLEARSRRNNIRIIGVPEEKPSTTVAISKLLKEVLNIDKDIIIDRSHRTLQPRPKPGARPRVIVARLHYHSDCVEVLKRAREKRQLKVGDMSISIFPDFTAKTARARSAFNDVRRLLRSIPGVKFGFLHPAKLRVTFNGVERQFNSPDLAKSYVNSLQPHQNVSSDA